MSSHETCRTSKGLRTTVYLVGWPPQKASRVQMRRSKMQTANDVHKHKRFATMKDCGQMLCNLKRCALANSENIKTEGFVVRRLYVERGNSSAPTANAGYMRKRVGKHHDCVCEWFCILRCFGAQTNQFIWERIQCVLCTWNPTSASFWMGKCICKKFRLMHIVKNVRARVGDRKCISLFVPMMFWSLAMFHKSLKHCVCASEKTTAQRKEKMLPLACNCSMDKQKLDGLHTGTVCWNETVTMYVCPCVCLFHDWTTPLGERPQTWVSSFTGTDTNTPKHTHTRTHTPLSLAHTNKPNIFTRAHNNTQYSSLCKHRCKPTQHPLHTSTNLSSRFLTQTQTQTT